MLYAHQQKLLDKNPKKHLLRDYQQNVVDNAPNMWGLWFRMRVGKTPTAIRLATTRVDSALVICPKSLTEQWKKEIIRWNNNSSCNIAVISKEIFRRDWNKLDKFQAIIIDECHRAFANYKTKLYKAGENYLKKHNIKFLWLLSGTPFTATSWSIYSYGKLLGKAWKWPDWSSTFFYNIRMGNRMVPLPKKDMDGRLQAILKSIGTVIDIKDVAEVVDDEDVFEYFDLNKDQQKVIDNLLDTLPVSRYAHIHEIESGVLKTDGYVGGLKIECSKDKRVMELVEENDKIIIVARYLDQIEKYYQLLKKYNKNIFIIRGGTVKTASEIAVEAENSEKAILLIQSDTCDGYSLKSFNITVFASLSYSFVNYDQIRFRTKAIEKKTPNTYIHLITRDKTIASMRKSMDQAVYDSVANKQDFNITLYGKKSA